jgi:hypothetical protein
MASRDRYHPALIGLEPRVDPRCLAPMPTFSTPEHAARLAREAGFGDSGRNNAATALRSRREKREARVRELMARARGENELAGIEPFRKQVGW